MLPNNMHCLPAFFLLFLLLRSCFLQFFILPPLTYQDSSLWSSFFLICPPYSICPPSRWSKCAQCLYLNLFVMFIKLYTKSLLMLLSPSIDCNISKIGCKWVTFISSRLSIMSVIILIQIMLHLPTLWILMESWMKDYENATFSSIDIQLCVDLVSAL